ncbi:MAG: sodium:proton antiporter [Gemmatimonadota bacterium]
MAILVTITALLGWVNERWLGINPVIGVTLGGLLVSLLLLVLGQLGLWGFGAEFAQEVLGRLDFDELLLHGLLGAILFAGALDIELNELVAHRWLILVLATAGVVVSMILVGTVVWLLAGWMGLELPYFFALLFGALISPTDPVAVLAILKRAGTPADLTALISGESLFNDGIGVVVFTVILGVAVSGHATVEHVAELFVFEAMGGVVYGLALGYAAFVLLRSVDDYAVEILITMAVVTGGYALALRLHTSGPLAMVVAGLLIGNRGRALAMSEQTRRNLDTFWVVVDETLNAMLFLLIGLEVLALELRWEFLVAGLVAVPTVLAARFISVTLPISTIRLRRDVKPYTVRLLTWGGLRGGIAIALALSIPPRPERDLILAMTYVVVVFSILVQGLTVEPLARRRTAAVGEGSGPASAPLASSAASPQPTE